VYLEHRMKTLLVEMMGWEMEFDLVQHLVYIQKLVKE